MVSPGTGDGQRCASSRRTTRVARRDPVVEEESLDEPVHARVPVEVLAVAAAGHPSASVFQNIASYVCNSLP